ncbi:NADP-dependent oxidoreductase [Parasphingopyxis lamellibrachiae]|uniref:Enoyl reductase (ER) domain-containing protein n=1 Tax=Parasphingopyxis lamellibrachiae TaxID=680125 RepID=A0A3D9FHV9_9SPHN|nr:NADP-dependent oxidoreductase [Parasphingopyxis lamellibrachiae]RED17365.1 hypothetical protein DFR46_2411 [Parasphingopyxis lamellibrachiae]
MTDTGRSPDTNRSWRLDRRPDSDPADGNLRLHREGLPEIADGEILVRNVYLSIDPTHRIWMSDIDQYMDPVELGDVMRGGTIGVVEQTRSSRLSVGDIVTGQGGWQDYCALSARMVRKIELASGLPLTAYMGPLGNIGATAYFGLLEIGKPRPGETVVVSAAAGAVGSLVGQIAKLMGCHVVGIAGSDEKCAWLTDDLGFDASVNYKSGSIYDTLEAACPNGIDVYFDNVGGEILDTALTLINLNARIATCGLISTYNDLEQGGQGPKMYRNVLMKRATIRGFIVSDFLRRYPEAFAAIRHWLRIGALQYRVDVREGLEHAPDVLKLLFSGRHDGKLIVKISEEP